MPEKIKTTSKNIKYELAFGGICEPIHKQLNAIAKLNNCTCDIPRKYFIQRVADSITFLKIHGFIGSTDASIAYSRLYTLIQKEVRFYDKPKKRTK